MAIGFKPVDAKPVTATEVQQAQKRAFAPIIDAMERDIADAMLPAMAKAARSAGRPASGKIRVTLLIDPAVVAKFKATGPGWQARMNDALRKATPRPD